MTPQVSPSLISGPGLQLDCRGLLQPPPEQPRPRGELPRPRPLKPRVRRVPEPQLPARGDHHCDGINVDPEPQAQANLIYYT